MGWKFSHAHWWLRNPCDFLAYLRFLLLILIPILIIWPEIIKTLSAIFLNTLCVTHQVLISSPRVLCHTKSYIHYPQYIYKSKSHHSRTLLQLVCYINKNHYHCLMNENTHRNSFSTILIFVTRWQQGWKIYLQRFLVVETLPRFYFWSYSVGGERERSLGAGKTSQLKGLLLNRDDSLSPLLGCTRIALRFLPSTSGHKQLKPQNKEGEAG